MPVNFLVLGLIHLALPRARIIHCRRNPLDTCLSIYSTPMGNPVDFAHERANLVFYYEQYLKLMAHWRQVIPPEGLLEIDYESLVTDPAPVTRALIDFCGVEWDEACLLPERNRHVIVTPSVWQARQPVYRSAVGRWKRYEPWLGVFKKLQKRAAPSRGAALSHRSRKSLSSCDADGRGRGPRGRHPADPGSPAPEPCRHHRAGSCR